MLTQRRLEFLEAVKKLYRETNCPVHYEAIGRLLNVSKWTAYDMVKALEKLGYVEKCHMVQRGAKLPGRSQVKYVPTSKGEPEPELKERSLGREGREPDSWEKWKMDLLSATEGNPLLSEEEVSFLLQRLNGAKGAVEYCAVTFVLMFLLAKSRGRRSMGYLIEMIHNSVRNDLGLGMVAGFFLGMMKTAHKRMGIPNFLQLIQSFQKQMESLGNQEKRQLQDFLNELAKRIA